MTESEQLAQLLVRWEELRQDGEEPKLEELCKDHPELIQKLMQKIHAMERMETLLGISQSNPEETATNLLQYESPQLPTIPGYEIEEVIGRGGVGVVYKAQQLSLNRTVAIKMLDASMIGTRQLERFLDEAHAIASLKHPNIVQIYDFGQADTLPFFSMEYVQGGSLKDRLEKGPLDILEAIRLTQTIAEVIHNVHEQGFAHRDLKPANILLTQEGQPKITDFGLIKRLNDDSGNTQTGEILGTVGYMAPEQLDHSLGEIGPKTDIYALGTLFFEMLTGESAFSSNPATLLKQVLNEEIKRPSQIRPTLPSDLDAICLKCLELNSNYRYESAEHLAQDLKRFQQGKPVFAQHVGFSRRLGKWIKRHPQQSTAILILILIAALQPLIAFFNERQKKRNLYDRAVKVAPLAREILHRNCYECHGEDPSDVSEELDVLDYEQILNSKRRIVVPGDPENSRLIQRIADGSMPPEKKERELPRLTEKELNILDEWILGGAPPFPEESNENPTPPVVQPSKIAQDAKKTLIKYCYACHKYSEAEGGIKILHHRLLIHIRKVVIPFDPENSELYQLMITEDKKRLMPPPKRDQGTPTEEEIKVIYQWIKAGAPAFTKD